MTPKALSREELEIEIKFLKEKIKWLERESIYYRVAVFIGLIVAYYLGFIN